MTAVTAEVLRLVSPMRGAKTPQPRCSMVVLMARRMWTAVRVNAGLSRLLRRELGAACSRGMDGRAKHLANEVARRSFGTLEAPLS